MSDATDPLPIVDDEMTCWDYMSTAPKDCVIMGFQHDKPAIIYFMMWWEPTSSWEFMKPNPEGTKFVLDQSRDWKPAPDSWQRCNRPRFAGSRPDQPKIDWEALPEGATIMVKVDGVEYPTVKVNNVQRFIEDRDHWLVKQIPKVWDSYLEEYIDDMDVMTRRYHRKEFSKRDYMEMNMAVGYSVSGFCDVFRDVDVENPLW